VDQLAARLDHRFRLLTVGSRTALPRQQTLRATLDWSYNLLSEPERRLFNRLSVFAGGWRLEAAEAVGAGDGLKPEDVLDLLQRLVKKSLVVAEESGDGSERYRLLETLRQYAYERLTATGELESIQGRHASYYLAFVKQTESLESRPPIWHGTPAILPSKITCEPPCAASSTTTRSSTRCGSVAGSGTSGCGVDS